MEAMNMRWKGLFGYEVISEIYTDPSWVMHRGYDPHSVTYHLHIQVNSVHLYTAVGYHLHHSCCRIFINNCHEIARANTKG